VKLLFDENLSPALVANSPDEMIERVGSRV
jgi:hypothetical protein